MFNRKLIGQRMRALRDHLDYSQNTVATESGMTQSDVSQFENTGGGMTLFLKLVNYYNSKDINVSNILKDNFIITPKTEPSSVLSKIENVHQHQMKTIINETIELENYTRDKLLSIKLLATGSASKI